MKGKREEGRHKDRGEREKERGKEIVTDLEGKESVCDGRGRDRDVTHHFVTLGK